MWVQYVWVNQQLCDTHMCCVSIMLTGQHSPKRREDRSFIRKVLVWSLAPQSSLLKQPLSTHWTLNYRHRLVCCNNAGCEYADLIRSTSLQQETRLFECCDILRCSGAAVGGHTVAQKDGRGQHLNNALFVLIHPKCAEKTSHVTPPPPPPGTTDKKQDPHFHGVYIKVWPHRQNDVLLQQHCPARLGRNMWLFGFVLPSCQLTAVWWFISDLWHQQGIFSAAHGISPPFLDHSS